VLDFILSIKGVQSVTDITFTKYSSGQPAKLSNDPKFSYSKLPAATQPCLISDLSTLYGSAMLHTLNITNAK
jgi:hypothetical protein